VDAYWDRYCGWPDLFVYKNQDFFFAEVKSAGDELSKSQKQWIHGNREHLRLPFKLVKVREAIPHADEQVSSAVVRPPR
jgi:hypothetical protein